MASMRGGRLKYLRNGFAMLELTKNLTNGLCMWEMTCICGKWFKYFRNGQKYVGNDVDLWEMAQICGEMA